MNVDFKIDGMEELERKLLKLPAAASGKVLRRALIAGAGVIQKEAKLRAPLERIRTNIRKVSRLVGGYKAEAGIRIKEGATYSRKKGMVTNYGAWFWHLFEHGTEERFQSSTGKYVGHIKPQPYLMPAFDTKAGAAIEKVKDQLAKSILKEAKK